METTDEMINLVDAELSKMPTFAHGDLVVVVAGSPAQHCWIYQPDPGAPRSGEDD